MSNRNKVFLIQGLDHLANSITISPQERVNLDHVVATVALRYPALWPPEMGFYPNLNQLENEIKDFTQYLYNSEEHYCLIAEYANTMKDRGDDIRVVTGNCLSINWLHQSVMSLHKNNGQKIVQVYVESVEGVRYLSVDGVKRKYEESMNIIEDWRQIL